MAYNTLEYLEQGKVEFVNNQTPYDRKNLIKYVRSHERKHDIIKGFLAKLIDTNPGFCFDIIFDDPKYAKETTHILERYYSIEYLSKEQLIGILNNSAIGKNYLEINFDAILQKHINDLDFLFNYMFTNLNANFSLLQTLAIHSNLKIRYLFMKYLLSNHADLTPFFYDDITRYLTSVTYTENEQLTFLPTTMTMPNVCELADIAFTNGEWKLWENFKNFIFQNYESNNLAEQLVSGRLVRRNDGCLHLVSHENAKVEFAKDADRLFQTSNNYRLMLLKYHNSQISKELLKAYQEQFKYFYRKDRFDSAFETLDFNGLTRKLATYIDKYLELSKNKSYEYLEAGSTASCFRIGDFVFKLVKTKWSYESVICPNLYLILPNLEEVFVRRNDGVISAGIEIQRYLPRNAKSVPPEIFGYFSRELSRLGYYTTDTLINGVCGDNCRLLDSYMDSTNPNPPDWFKSYPLVLVDRDRVYHNSNKCPKQLSSGY